jgi:hypothetical protein
MDENLARLRDVLMQHEDWPMQYYFKFIVPNEKEKLESIKRLFLDPSKITYNASRDINYIGVSYKQYMPDVDSIIAIYLKARSIKGVIAL